MTHRCTAPKQGHESERARLACPACGTKSVRPTLDVSITPPSTNAVRDTASLAEDWKAGINAASTLFVVLEEQERELDDLRRRAVATSMAATAKAALAVCPKVDDIRWAQHSEDYGSMAMLVSCSCDRATDDALAEDFFLDHADDDSLASFAYLSADYAALGAQALGLQSNARGYDPHDPRAEFYFDKEDLHLLRLGVNPTNKGARELITKDPKWQEYTADSPVVLLALKTFPNAGEY